MAFCQARNTDISYGTVYPPSQFNDVGSDQHQQLHSKLRPVAMNASNRTECLPGTRASILRSIDDWIGDGSKEKRVIWLHGMAGAGKSAISATIANACRADGRLGAFLFFDRDVAQGNDPGGVIRTIAYQMGSYDRHLGTLISGAIENIPENSFPPLQLQFRKFIVEPLSRIRRSTTLDEKLYGKNMGKQMPVVVVLDGLDECGDPRTREDLLKVLAEETAGLAPILRVIVTSRAVSDIRGFFGKKEHILPYELDTTSDTNTADIRLFLLHRAKEIRNSAKSLRLPGDWPGELIIQDLTTRAHGLFLWAATAMEFINGHSPQKRVEMLLRSQASSTAIGALDILYQMALESAGIWQDHDFVKDFRMIMGLVTTAKHPLSCAAIDQLLHPSLGQPSMHTVSRFRCVLSQSPTVRMVHTSFADFLCSRQQCGRDIWFIDPTTHHRALAMGCLELLNNTLKRNMCNLTLSMDLETETLPEALAYACRFWVEHLCRIEDDIPPVLAHLNTFLNRHLLHWFEAMSILKSSKDTVALLNNLAAWITDKSSYQTNFLGVVRDAWHTLLNNILSYITPKFDIETSLLELVHDACLFSQTFGKSIEEHPLLVYFGALPFTPIKSAIYIKFHDDTLFPSVSGGFVPEWRPLAVRSHAGGYATQDGTDTVSAVASVVFSLDAKLVASGSHSGVISLWDAETGQVIATPLEGHTGQVAALAFSPDGGKLVSGSHDATIRIWDVKTGRTIAGPLQGHTNWVTSVVFSPDGKLVASGSHDHTVDVWHVETGQLFAGPFGHADWVTSVAFSPDGRWVASGSNDQRICMWDIETGQFKGSQNWVTPVTCNLGCTGPVSRFYNMSTIERHSALGVRLSSTYVTPSCGHTPPFYISSHMIEVSHDGWLVHMQTNQAISKLPTMITPLCSASNETSVIIGTQDGQVIIINFPLLIFTSSYTQPVESKLLQL